MLKPDSSPNTLPCFFKIGKSSKYWYEDSTKSKHFWLKCKILQDEHSWAVTGKPSAPPHTAQHNTAWHSSTTQAAALPLPYSNTPSCHLALEQCTEVLFNKITCLCFSLSMNELIGSIVPFISWFILWKEENSFWGFFFHYLLLCLPSNASSGVNKSNI